MTKDAAGSFDRVYTWGIVKEYDATYDKFFGDPATTHGYEVTVDQTVTDGNFAVTGSITIANNTPFDATIESVSDVLNDGTAATVDCGVSFPYALVSGGSLTCSYTASPSDASATLNTVKELLAVHGPSGELPRRLQLGPLERLEGKGLRLRWVEGVSDTWPGRTRVESPEDADGLRLRIDRLASPLELGSLETRLLSGGFGGLPAVRAGDGTRDERAIRRSQTRLQGSARALRDGWPYAVEYLWRRGSAPEEAARPGSAQELEIRFHGLESWLRRVYTHTETWALLLECRAPMQKEAFVRQACTGWQSAGVAAAAGGGE